jgi:hypothetical protein
MDWARGMELRRSQYVVARDEETFRNLEPQALAQVGSWWENPLMASEKFKHWRSKCLSSVADRICTQTRMPRWRVKKAVEEQFAVWKNTPSAEAAVYEEFGYEWAVG